MFLCCLILIAAFKIELLNSNMTYITILVYPSMKVILILYICHFDNFYRAVKSSR
jgi:hypothetical protein